ncbi:type 1 periplasmic-binding domain-containing protein [Saccharopolyspora rosea]|uniref:hypothetical protein n=1 Tax=Saccharopolyspora rosea TaxID=524884 RepID=UPI0021D92F91|nr:hypothetical protein [Saccharopolyspora rosea]
MLLTGGGVGYSVYGDQHCGVPLSRPWAWFTGEGALEAMGECVGVTDGAFVSAFLNPAAQAPADVHQGLLRTGGILQQQNDQAVRTSVEDRRPLVTLAYLGDFSGNSSVELTAEHETLAGIAVAQRDQNSRESSSAPVVRVLVANGGGNMRHASYVVRTYLSGIAANQDERLIGVVGLNHSRTETVSAIEEVTRLGLPIVASTLSYDHLSDYSPLYFQVSPQNRQEAQQAAEYFRERGNGEVGVYRDLTDAYSANLGEDVADELGKAGRTARWLSPAKPYDAGRAACGDGEVYYAARATNFNDFLRGVSDGCGGGPLPDILAGDDVTQHVADRVRRERFLGIPYSYQSFAVGPTRPDPDDAANNLKPNEYTFYCSLNRFLAGDGVQDKCPPRAGDLSLDGHAALAYDATRVLLNAAERLQSTVAGPERTTASVPITPGAVWRELNSVRAPEQQESLVTGVIDFGSDTTKRVPINKRIWILRVRGGEVEPPSDR